MNPFELYVNGNVVAPTIHVWKFNTNSRVSSFWVTMQYSVSEI